MRMKRYFLEPWNIGGSLRFYREREGDRFGYSTGFGVDTQSTGANVVVGQQIGEK